MIQKSKLNGLTSPQSIGKLIGEELARVPDNPIRVLLAPGSDPLAPIA